MQLREILLDAIINTKLFEMATERSDALKLVLSLSPLIDEHVLKIVMYPDASANNHWRTEANGWLRAIQRIKTRHNKKRLDAQTLLTYLWKNNFETIEEVNEWMSDIDEDYRHRCKMVRHDPAENHKILLDIFTNVCFDISKGTFKSIGDYV